MNALEHPVWCDQDRCKAETKSGPHESRPVRLTAGQGGGKTPRVLLVLWSPANGRPVRIRMVVISDLLINTLDVDLAAAAALSARLQDLIGQANGTNG